MRLVAAHLSLKMHRNSVYLCARHTIGSTERTLEPFDSAKSHHDAGSVGFSNRVDTDEPHRAMADT